MLDCRAILVSGCVHRIYLWRLHPQRQPIGAIAAIAAIAATPSRFAISPSASSYGAARLRTLALEAECIVCIGCWCLAGDGPEEAIVIEELPFFFSGNSAEYTSTVSLGGGPDVFFTFTSATEVSRIACDPRWTCTRRALLAVLMKSRTSPLALTRAGPYTIQYLESTSSRMETWCSLQLMMTAHSVTAAVTAAPSRIISTTM